jgi:hypothetical protein
MQILAELRDLNARRKALDYERDMAELALKTRMGDAEALINLDGKPLCTWKNSLQPESIPPPSRQRACTKPIQKPRIAGCSG